MPTFYCFLRQKVKYDEKNDLVILYDYEMYFLFIV